MEHGEMFNSALHSYTPAIWKEFVSHIISIEDDTVNFGINAMHEKQKPSPIFKEILKENLQNEEDKLFTRRFHPITQTSSVNKNLIASEDPKPNTDILDISMIESEDSFGSEENGDKPSNETYTKHKTTSQEEKNIKRSISFIDTKKSLSKFSLEENQSAFSDSPEKQEIPIKTNRRSLYRKYIDQPNDWRTGFSSYTMKSFKHIFHEADVLQKEVRFSKTYGTPNFKMPQLKDRLFDDNTSKKSNSNRKHFHRQFSNSTHQSSNSSLCNSEHKFITASKGVSKTLQMRPKTSPVNHSRARLNKHGLIRQRPITANLVKSNQN